MHKFLITSAVLLSLGATLVMAGPHCRKYNQKLDEAKIEKRIHKQVKRLEKRLDLSPEQAAQVAKILRARSAKMLAMAKEHRTRVRTLARDFRSDMHAVLTDNQKVKFDKKFDRKLKRHHL